MSHHIILSNCLINTLALLFLPVQKDVSLIFFRSDAGRTIETFILILLLIGVLVCYQDWIQAGILIILYLILFALLFVGTAVEVILEEIRSRVMGFILS